MVESELAAALKLEGRQFDFERAAQSRPYLAGTTVAEDVLLFRDLGGPLDCVAVAVTAIFAHLDGLMVGRVGLRLRLQLVVIEIFVRRICRGGVVEGQKLI